MSQAGRFNGSNNGGAVVETLTGNVGGPVPPDGLGNIDVLGNENINTVGNPGTNTLEINLNETIHWPDTNAAGTTGVIYLGATGGIGGTPFLHAYDPVAAGGNSDNVFLGRMAGNFTLTAQGNVGIGTMALITLTTGGSNTAIGFGSGPVSSGNNNVAVGFEAGIEGSGDGNIGVGVRAGRWFLDPSAHNTCMGFESGPPMSSSVGSFNIIIGSLAGSSNSSLTQNSNIYIGNPGLATDNNTLRLGTHGTGNRLVNRCFIGGINGVNVGSVATVVSFDPADNQLGQTAITAGTGITVTPGANTITIAASGTMTMTVTLVNTSPYVVLATDQYLSVDCSGGAITIQLPNVPATGRVFTVKDSTGSANTNNITVTTVGGVVLIDGATTYVMNTQYSAINVIFNGTAYEIY